MRSRFDTTLIPSSGSCSSAYVAVHAGYTGANRKPPFPCLYHREEPRLKFFEESTYTPGVKNSRKLWNLFEHYKKSLIWPYVGTIKIGSTKFLASSHHRDFFFISTPTWGYRSENGFGAIDGCSYGLPSLYVAGGQTIVPDPPNLNDLMFHSLKAMLPGIRADISLLNSVYELKDFKSLPRTLAKLWDLRALFKKKRRTSPLRTLLQAGSDVYLQSQFNVLPLLDDISKLWKSLQTFRSEVAKLLAGEKRRLRRHYKTTVASPYINSTETKPRFATYSAEKLCVTSVANNPETVSIDGKTELTRHVRYGKAEFHAEVEYTYYLTNYQREHAYHLGLLDKWGINLNPQIIWNAIPWSFVVDWTIGVNRWLKQFESRNLEPVTVIHRYLWSWHVKRQIQVVSKNNLEVAWLVPVTQDVVWIDEEAYKRVPCMPNIYQALQASGLNLKEFSLASALVASRQPGKK